MAALPLCSFARTGPRFESQRIARCLTCALTHPSCICETCANVCHAGHNVVIEPTPSSAYCDCHTKGGCCTLPAGTPRALPAQHCTFENYGASFIRQAICECRTCGLTGSKIACWPCAAQCHAGHDVVFLRYSSGAYCDCANTECCTLLPPGSPSSASTSVPVGARTHTPTAFVGQAAPDSTVFDPMGLFGGDGSHDHALASLLAAMQQFSVGAGGGASVDRASPHLHASTATRGSSSTTSSSSGRALVPVPSDLCTTTRYASDKISMQAFHCYTCGLLGDGVACAVCAATCHVGHHVVPINTARQGDSVCACGLGEAALPCRCLKRVAPTLPTPAGGDGTTGSSDRSGSDASSSGGNSSVPGGGKRGVPPPPVPPPSLLFEYNDMDSPWLFGHADPYNHAAAAGAGTGTTTTLPAATPPSGAEAAVGSCEATPIVTAAPQAKDRFADTCCIICFDGRQDTVMVPCGHIPACWACSLSILAGKAGGTAAARGKPSCPICRAKVTSVIKLYVV